jgi:hypothetical protein
MKIIGFACVCLWAFLGSIQIQFDKGGKNRISFLVAFLLNSIIYNLWCLIMINDSNGKESAGSFEILVLSLVLLFLYKITDYYAWNSMKYLRLNYHYFYKIIGLIITISFAISTYYFMYNVRAHYD